MRAAGLERWDTYLKLLKVALAADKASEFQDRLKEEIAERDEAVKKKEQRLQTPYQHRYNGQYHNQQYQAPPFIPIVG